MIAATHRQGDTEPPPSHRASRRTHCQLSDRSQHSPHVGSVAHAERVGTAFDVVLESFNSTEKIGIVRAVRLATGASARQSLDMVDAAPQVIKEGMPKLEAECLKAVIEEAGGKVTLRCIEEGSAGGILSDQSPQAPWTKEEEALAC